jgi:DNA-binding transcriptional regulator GbsR (MarR family)
MKNVWDMFRIVLDERKRREIDPTITLLEECIAEAGKNKEPDKHTEERLRELHRFFETTTAWYTQVAKLRPSALEKFLKAGDRILKGLGLG